MSHRKQRRFILILLAVILSMAFGGAALAWFAPLIGAPLPQQNFSFNPAAFEQKPEGSEPKRTTAPVLVEDQKIQEVTETFEIEVGSSIAEQTNMPVCKGPESMAILVLGIDENAQADAIRLVRVDFLKNKVAVVSIPRDFYVPIVDMAEPGINQGRINATYGYGEWFNGRGQGIISVANYIEHNFGVTFDHYILLNFKDIAAYIDQVGGIELLLEQPVADGSRYFSSGLHNMDGQTAVGFMRMRYYDTDFARIKRQSMVLRAFFKKAMQELNVYEQTQLGINGLLDKNIQSDFAVKDLSSLICLAGLVDRNDVDFVEIPGEMYTGFTTSSGGNVQIPYADVVPFIQSVMNGSYSEIAK